MAYQTARIIKLPRLRAPSGPPRTIAPTPANTTSGLRLAPTPATPVRSIAPRPTPATPFGAQPVPSTPAVRATPRSTPRATPARSTVTTARVAPKVISKRIIPRRAAPPVRGLITPTLPRPKKRPVVRTGMARI